MHNHLPQLEVKSAQGSKIFLKNGKILIDGISSWWSIAHGYNHPHLVEAVTRQARELSHIMLAGFAVDESYQLAYRLAKIAPKNSVKNLNKVFFADSGSVAIEVAMKIAWQYFINLGQKEKTKFVAFKDSYHGDTTGAMSLADPQSSMHQKFAAKLIQNFCVPLPRSEREIIEFEKFIIKNREVIAGVFVEPLVQAAGGMKFSSPEILAAIAKIVAANNCLLIADECATGFYRTGKKFAVDHADVVPDILVIGKALTGGMITLAAALTTDEIFDSFLGDSMENALMHGPTFMGNPLACAAANASLDLFEQNDYAKLVVAREEIMVSELKNLTQSFPDLVKDVRVFGAIGVVEIKGDYALVRALRQKFVEFGSFLRPFMAGEDSIIVYLMPALNIEDSELKFLINAIYKALKIG